MSINRRQMLVGTGAFGLGTAGLGGYAVGIEPAMVPVVRRYDLLPPNWSAGLDLRIAIIADIHACRPWMPPERIRRIAEQANAIEPDLILILGDFNAGHRIVTGPVWPREWADALGVLRAPLGTYAILGNHDWWHGPVPGMPGGAEEVRRGLRSIGIRVLENDVVRLAKDGQPFCIAGLADQMAYHNRPGGRGADDLAATLKHVGERAPVIMMAHEPYAFRRMPERVSLTLSGHTHGGQVVVPGLGPIVTPSRRYNYGHIVEGGRHLIVSAGLGESGAPVRFGVPPELLDLRLGGLAPTLA